MRKQGYIPGCISELQLMTSWEHQKMKSTTSSSWPWLCPGTRTSGTIFASWKPEITTEILMSLFCFVCQKHKHIFSRFIYSTPFFYSRNSGSSKFFILMSRVYKYFWKFVISYFSQMGLNKNRKALFWWKLFFTLSSCLHFQETIEGVSRRRW